MSKRKSRFNHPQKFQNSQKPRNLGAKNFVYRDSSYFKFLATKSVISEFSAENFVELLNASELAKSRKTWPFYSEELESGNNWSKVTNLKKNPYSWFCNFYLFFFESTDSMNKLKNIRDIKCVSSEWVFDSRPFMYNKIFL